MRPSNGNKGSWFNLPRRKGQEFSKPNDSQERAEQVTDKARDEAARTAERRTRALQTHALLLGDFDDEAQRSLGVCNDGTIGDGGLTPEGVKLADTLLNGSSGETAKAAQGLLDERMRSVRRWAALKTLPFVDGEPYSEAAQEAYNIDAYGDVRPGGLTDEGKRVADELADRLDSFHSEVTAEGANHEAHECSGVEDGHTHMIEVGHVPFVLLQAQPLDMDTPPGKVAVAVGVTIGGGAQGVLSEAMLTAALAQVRDGGVPDEGIGLQTGGATSLSRLQSENEQRYRRRHRPAGDGGRRLFGPAAEEWAAGGASYPTAPDPADFPMDAGVPSFGEAGLRPEHLGDVEFGRPHPTYGATTEYPAPGAPPADAASGTPGGTFGDSGGSVSHSGSSGGHDDSSGGASPAAGSDFGASSPSSD